MIDFPTKPLTYPCDSYVANLKATFHEHREVFISRLRSNHLLHCGAKIGIFGATHYVCLSTNRRGAIFAASLECKHSDSALDYTPCELAFFKAVLRTMFCLRQNARGAIFAHSLECEHSDSFRLIFTTAVPSFQVCGANISRLRSNHFNHSAGMNFIAKRVPRFATPPSQIHQRLSQRGSPHRELP